METVCDNELMKKLDALVNALIITEEIEQELKERLKH
jgi:hypothetical protein